MELEFGGEVDTVALRQELVIALRPGESQFAVFDAVNFTGRGFLGEGESDSTGSGAQIDGDYRVMRVRRCRNRCGHRVDSGLRDRFSFGARNEYAWPNSQFQIAKGRFTGQVLQRDSLGAVGHELVIIAEIKIEVAARNLSGCQFAAGDSQQVRSEEH